MDTQPIIISLKIYKHRESEALITDQKCKLCPFSDTKDVWNNNNCHWFFCENIPLTKLIDKEQKYPGYTTFSSIDNMGNGCDHFGPLLGVCPAFGIILVKVNDRLVKRGYSYRYQTVQLHDGFKETRCIEGSTFIKTKTLTNLSVDTSSLESTFWKQFSIGNNRLLLRFSKINFEPFQLQSHSDDFTGQLFCYTLTRVLYLKRHH